MTSDGEARVLSYHDVLLRKADVELLRGPHWLNDQVIAFYFEYLLRESHPNISNAVALVPGAMSFLLTNSDPSEAAIIFEALKLHEKDLVVFAANDNPDAEWAGGGAHWSCLAYHRASNAFRHYDSAKPHNSKVAKTLAGAAAPLVRSRTAAANCSSTSNSSSKSTTLFPSFVEADMPQQQNGNDCGMYVLAVTKALCNNIATHKQAEGISNGQGAGNGDTTAVWELSEQQEAELLQPITAAAVRKMREEILQTIDALVAKSS